MTATLDICSEQQWLAANGYTNGIFRIVGERSICRVHGSGERKEEVSAGQLPMHLGTTLIPRHIAIALGYAELTVHKGESAKERAARIVAPQDLATYIAYLMGAYLSLKQADEAAPQGMERRAQQHALSVANMIESAIKDYKP